MQGFLTRDPGVLRVLAMAEKAARSLAGVLITGESGTGKNVLARRIHDASVRAAGPFVEVACANLPAELLESELFGHERGAFTDAHEARAGRFEQADGGTLYLDEIQELDPVVQGKILRAIETKRFERLGGTRTLFVEARIIASTRRDPERLVAEGLLREDLYYRMNVVRLHLPPLRQRTGDIELLAEHFLADATTRHRLPAKRLSAEALQRLLRYPFPGNLRELAHAVESAAVLGQNDEIEVSDLPAEFSVSSAAMIRAAAEAALPLHEVEWAYIEEVLRRTEGNKSLAARILGIHRKTLHEKIRSRADKAGVS